MVVPIRFCALFFLTCIAEGVHFNDIMLFGERRPLSETDELAILNTRTDKVTYREGDVDCLLRRFVAAVPVQRCGKLESTKCAKEYVLIR